MKGVRRSLTFKLMPDEHQKLQETAEYLGVNMTDLIKVLIRKLPDDKSELDSWINKS
jgi:hypothetical protein